MHTYFNTEVDLLNFRPEMVHLADIAHALHRNIRFNGHIDEDFTVYEHSMIGAAWADSPRHKLEALLHDAGEAYTGDIILPMKECFPEIAEFEDRITAVIFDKLWPNSGLTEGGVYTKSPYMIQLDRDMANCEAYEFRSHHPFTERTYQKHKEWQPLYEQLQDHMTRCIFFDGQTIVDVFCNYYEQLLQEVKNNNE